MPTVLKSNQYSLPPGYINATITQPGKNQRTNGRLSSSAQGTYRPDNRPNPGNNVLGFRYGYSPNRPSYKNVVMTITGAPADLSTMTVRAIIGGQVLAPITWQFVYAGSTPTEPNVIDLSATPTITEARNAILQMLQDNYADTWRANGVSTNQIYLESVLPGVNVTSPAGAVISNAQTDARVFVPFPAGRAFLPGFI